MWYQGDLLEGKEFVGRIIMAEKLLKGVSMYKLVCECGMLGAWRNLCRLAPRSAVGTSKDCLTKTKRWLIVENTCC